MAGYLYRAARGIDLRQVSAHRTRKSVGGERTFSEDISSGAMLRETLENIIDIVWERIERSQAKGRTITLKMKFNDFKNMTRSKSLTSNVADRDEFAEVSRALLAEVVPLPKPIRLMGLTLSNLEGDSEPKPKREDGQLSLL